MASGGSSKGGSSKGGSSKGGSSKGGSGRARSAITGRYVTKQTAQRHPDKTVVEHDKKK
jgi:hypothetical protein